MWQGEWQAYAKAFAEQAFVEKQGRKQWQSAAAKAELKRLAECRSQGQDSEAIQAEIFARWKAENRQAALQQQENKQGKRLGLSELPIFKALHLREGKTNE